MEPPNILRKHFIYWILPFTAVLLCILIYFFNWLGATEVISPSFNREFGLLESLQVLILVIIFYIAIKAAINKPNKLEKYLFAFIAVLSIFFLFEEIDYGLHYYDLLTGKEGEQKAFIIGGEEKIRNIHSTGKNTSILKMLSYIIIGLVMIILPLLPARIKQKNSFIAYISPSRYIVLTAIALVIINQIAFYIYKKKIHINRSLDSNISEFEELMFYYIIVLYIWEVAHKDKKWPFISQRKKDSKSAI